MEKYEQFANYINGGMDAGEEHQLFSAMSYDEELRNEFRRFVVIDNRLKRTSKSYIPPNDVTAAIYAGLGLAMAGSAAAAPVKKGFLKSNLFRGIASSAIALLFTLGAVYFINFRDGEGRNTSGGETEYRQATTPAVIHDTVVVARDLSPASTTAGTPAPRIIYIDRRDEGSRDKRIAANEQSAIDKHNGEFGSVEQIAEAKLNNDDRLTPERVAANTELPSTVFTPDVKSAPGNNVVGSGNPIGMSAEFKGSANWNQPKETIYPGEQSKFNNMNLALLYDVGSGFRLGAEVRQENFFLKYDGRDGRGEMFLYEQQPNFTSYGLLARYSLVEAGSFSSFIQAAGSFNSYGIIARPAFGLEYMLTGEFGITCQAEYSTMWFRHNSDKIFKSQKISLLYGVNYRF